MGKAPRLMWLCIAAVALAADAPAQPKSIAIGAVDFFGTAGVDLAAVRAAVPVRPGDTIAQDTIDGLKRRIGDAVARSAGAPATDVTLVCCYGGGGALLYIGLPGRNVGAVMHRPAPEGKACLTPDALRLYERAGDALQKAIESGDSAEDVSRGYAVSHHPAYRQAQLAMREYAVAHDSSIRAALDGCADAEHRAAAAQLLGYARRSRAQIDALVQASRDPERSVRNNAVRALWVLASARQKTSVTTIPAAAFVPLLNSPTWEDRNKAGLLLSALVTPADATLLDELRRTAMASLIEMARWHDRGHADAYRLLLGRIAGLGDRQLNEFMSAGEVEKIVAAAERR